MEARWDEATAILDGRRQMLEQATPLVTETACLSSGHDVDLILQYT